MAEVADDIDDLLDEVEIKFLTRDGQNKLTRPRPRSTCQLKQTSSSTDSSRDATDSESTPSRNYSQQQQDSVGELENAIEELCNMPPDSSADLEDKATKRPSSGQVTGSPIRKCFVAYLGGTQYLPGLSTSVIQRPCGNLQCTTCDFKVAAFEHYAWDDSTEHIFLRNNMPDFDRLRAKLHTQRGWCAYACQCHCTSIKSLVELRSHEILKWVCAGH